MRLNSVDFSEWCFNQAVRIGTILNVGASHDGESGNDSIEDLIDGHTDKELGEIFGKGLSDQLSARLKDERKYSKGKKSLTSKERVAETLQYFVDNRMYGYVVYVERAVHTFRADDSASYSFGHMNVKLIYGDDLDEKMVEKIQAWDTEMVAKEKAKVVA